MLNKNKKHINKILYINLKHRTDRNDNVKRQLSELYPNNKNNFYERIDAVNGAKLDINNISPNLITDKGKQDALDKELPVYLPLTRGAIGCALSHHKVYKKIVDENIPITLILEDDITIDPEFNEKIDEILDKCPDDFDILFLGYHNATLIYLQRDQINDTINKSAMVFGLFGYIVTNKGAQKLLNIFPITKQIDTEISYNIYHDKNDKLETTTYVPENIIHSFNLGRKKKPITNETLALKAYIINPFKQLIFSDESSTTSRFGTDIQIRENFNNVFCFNEEITNYMILFTCFILILLLIYAFIINK